MSHEESHIVKALASLCTSLGVTCLIQVGAEDGYEADYLRTAAGCRTIAIEGNSALRPYSSDLEYHHAVIGATDSMASFYINQDTGLSGQLPERGRHTVAQAYRLDTFCQLHGLVPDAIMIDTEGTTMDVLEGCNALLDNVKIIYAECQTPGWLPGHHPLSEVDAFLNLCGMTQHQGLPTYDAGCQGNYTWVRGYRQ